MVAEAEDGMKVWREDGKVILTGRLLVAGIGDAAERQVGNEVAAWVQWSEVEKIGEMMVEAKAWPLGQDCPEQVCKAKRNGLSCLAELKRSACLVGERLVRTPSV